MKNYMKKSILILFATFIYVGISCQDKDINKMLNANQGITTPFINFPDGILDKKPVTNYPSLGIVVSTGSAWGQSIIDNSNNWNTAFGWGPHSGLYESKLSNPTVNGYVLSSTTTGVRTWIPNGSGGSMVYPPAGIPISTGSAWGTSIVNNSTNWNTAFSWGPHAGLYRSSTWVPTWTDVTGKPIFALVSTTGLFTDLLSKPTTVAGYGITNAMTTTHPANVITSTNITNWNTSFGWGNHAGLYRPITWVPSWTDVTAKPTLFPPTSHTHDYNSDITNKPPEKDLMEALGQLDYFLLNGKTTAEINAFVIPAGKGAIAFDATLGVYKVYKNGIWAIIITSD